MNSSRGDSDSEEIPEAQRVGEQYATLLNHDWQIDNPEQLLQPASDESLTLGNQTSKIPEASLLPTAEAVNDSEIPPTPLQIIEAMLFIGGSPLAAERACESIRGLTPNQFREWIEVLNRVYRMQNRPYLVVSGDHGYSLLIRQRYRSLRERLYGGPGEVRLSQAALDVLALIAYRQPISRAELDSIRGADSGSILRQLIRLGLIAIVQRADAVQREISYGTMPRFLEVFGLSGLNDLPQLAEPLQL